MSSILHQSTTWTPFAPGEEIVIQAWDAEPQRAIVSQCVPHYVGGAFIGGGAVYQSGWIVYVSGAWRNKEGKAQNYAHSEWCVSAAAYDALQEPAGGASDEVKP